jgi:dolichol-phosphate mannosyltransferase
VVRRIQAEMPEVRLHLNTLGPGPLNAIKAGLSSSRAEHVLVMMADGSDDAGDIDRMYALAAGGADVVAGSRYMRGGQQVGGPLVKRTLSRLAGLSLHHLAGVGTHDSTNNFKMYSRRLLNTVEIESQGGFELGLELTTKAHVAGMVIAEVPTIWRDRCVGESQFRLWRWLPYYLRWYVTAMRHRFFIGRTSAHD